MSQIPNSFHQRLIKPASFYRRAPYLRFVIIVLAGFFLTNIGVLVFAQSNQPALPSTNPFLEYVDIFPGQPLSSNHTRAFSCWGSNNYYSASEVTCRFSPISGVFSDIEVIISNGAIRQMTFTLRDNTMKIGDLVLLFDDVKFRTYPHKVFFFWNNLFVIVSTTANGNHPSFRPVWSVTFTNRY